VDLKLTDDDGVGLWARFYVGNPSMFTVLDANGDITGQGLPSTAGTIETPTFALDLAKSSFLGSGPTGPSVAIDFAVSFKPAAAGNEHSPNAARVYNVDISATSLNGSTQSPEQVGSWSVRPTH